MEKTYYQSEVGLEFIIYRQNISTIKIKLISAVLNEDNLKVVFICNVIFYYFSTVNKAIPNLNFFEWL